MSLASALLLVLLACSYVCEVASTAAQFDTEVGSAMLQVSSDEQRMKCNGTVAKVSDIKGTIFSKPITASGSTKYPPGANCQYVISGLFDSFTLLRNNCLIL